MRRGVAMLCLAFAGMNATACASPLVDACPAIGYVTVLQVDATAIADAAWVQLCDDAVCSPKSGASSTAAGQIASAERDGVWSFSFHGRAPVEVATVMVTDASGALLQKSDHRVDWAHSTARCGGPSTADTVVLQP